MLYQLKKSDDYMLGADKYLEFVKKEKPDSVVLINPNNPNGGYLKYKDLIGRTGSGMAYWCNTANQWEMLEPENVDTHHQSGSERIKACLGFAPSDGEERFNRRQVRKHVGAEGNPISQFGFPIAEQYNATGSQYIKMSDYIASPFLLEKAIIEIEGTFGFDGHAGAESQGYQKQFFMLNQMTDGDAPHYQKDFTLLFKFCPRY